MNDTNHMAMTNKAELKSLQLRLGSLLNQKQALNSNVTLKFFERFRDAAEKGTDAYEISESLNRLEQMLKQEGLFKNVKADFGRIKKDIHSKKTPRTNLPGLIAAKDKTFYVAPKGSSDNDPSKVVGGVSAEDMKSMNHAIGRLYRHLQLNQPKETDNRSSDSVPTSDAQKEGANILTVTHLTGPPEENFHELVIRLRNFEKEFQRQKVQQQRDVMRLQEEIKRLSKNASELKRENERYKGIQPIVTRAKGKQVEKIEERYRTEKKDFENKINVIEEELKRNLESVIQSKEETLHKFSVQIETLTTAVNVLHSLVADEDSDKKKSSGPHRPHEDMNGNVDDLIKTVTAVTLSVQVLKNRNQEMKRKVDDLTNWRKCLKDLDKEITRFSRPYGSIGDKVHETKIRGPTSLNDDPFEVLETTKTKLSKTKDNINVKLQEVSDLNTISKSKDRELSKLRSNMEEVASRITKLYDQLSTIQQHDIALSMAVLRKESRTDTPRLDSPGNDLPEADRHDQLDTIDKVKQIANMMVYLQQVSSQKSSIASKMENDLLPLKVRIHRMHDELNKAMTSISSRGSNSPESEDDLRAFRTHREKSQEEKENAFSKEIHDMLTKLSKMELCIRKLIQKNEEIQR
ncbi:hypothetical protein ACJMK2_031583 [Sinanodonta woodiana]|uniref:Uncharacterized protein n=1 Tax=Sinanodonta woodiana TaxID=1069815 RepID=A0ABD3X106_SINWO